MKEIEAKKQELHDKILALVREYTDEYHRPVPWTKGARIPYAGRVYDHEEMEALVDSSLEFWLTAGAMLHSSRRGWPHFSARATRSPSILVLRRICWLSWR